MQSRKARPVRIHRLVIVGMLLACLIRPAPALADVGTVWIAQGAAITPGEEPTRVQMMTETVTLSVEPLTTDDPSSARLDERMVVHVVANFEMLNRSTEVETLDVWFPLTTGIGYHSPSAAEYPSQAENFEAWVNGESVPVTEAPGRDLLGFRDSVPWATWPVTFSPEQEVQLRVTYDVHPVEWGGWAVVHYILETGAGWSGPIRRGTVTFRLPYEVTPMNVQLAEIRQAYAAAGRPFDVAVEGSDVTFRFTDLAPKPSSPDRLQALNPFPETDNLIVPLMPPSAWAEIEAAQADAEAHPESIEAQLRLAEALAAGTQRVKWLSDTETNALLIEETEATYQRALELAPEDVDARVAYLEWLAIPRYDDGEDPTLGPGFDALLAETQELAPGDQRVRRVAVSAKQWREERAAIRSEAPAPTVLMPASGSANRGGIWAAGVALVGLMLILSKMEVDR